MRKKGFALIEILIVAAVIALLAGSALYFDTRGVPSGINGAVSSSTNNPAGILQYVSATIHEYASSTNGEEKMMGN